MGKIIRHFLAVERDQWFSWFPVAMGIGIGSYFAMPWIPAPGWVPAFLALAALILAAASAVNVSPSPAKDNNILPSFAAVMLAAFALGWASSEWRVHHSQGPVLERKTPPVTVRGEVARIENLADGASRILLRHPTIGRIRAEDSPEYVRVTLRSGHDLAIGERVEVRAILFPPMRPAFPGGYDFSRASWFQGLGGVGYALSSPRVVGSRKDRDGAVRLADRRHRMARDIRRILPGDRGAVAAALLIGDRRAISEGTMGMIRSSGLAHLLAISGLHMGIVTGLFFVVFRAGLALYPRAVLYHPIKKWAAALALIAALGYLLLTGQTIPTQRAFLMTALVLLAVILDRRAISMRLVAGAAVVIFLMTPESLVGPSFQMSFAAVTALVAFYEGVRGSWNSVMGARHEAPFANRIALTLIGYVGAVLLTTLIASSATLPFAVYHFHQYAAYGMLSNVIAIPLMAFWVMPWGVLSLLILPFAEPTWTLAAMAGGIDIILGIAAFVADLPGSVIRWPKMPTAVLVLATLGGLWIALWRGNGRWWGLAGLVVAVLLYRQSPLPEVLIAGQGELVAVRVDGADGRPAELLASSLRARRILRDWSRAMGGMPIRPWREAPEAAPECDPIGCIVRRKGWTIAFAYRPEALSDCSRVDVLVAFFPVRGRCRGPEVILDRFDLWRDGTHALYLDRGRIDIETVRRHQGSHPWVRPR